jgi:threonylcarbamoyladenosine tRNA methylthiotransferase MtaB
LTLDIITFGCRLNAFESEAIRQHAAAAGLDDAIVVNTCAVTAEAERQARQAIRRLRRERPGARLIVTGCAAQIDPARFAAMPEIDRILGNEEKLDPASYRGEGPRIAVGDIARARTAAPVAIDRIAGSERAYLQIQTGCDHRCTFCTIPLGRGPSRSVPAAAAIAQARALVARGYRELVLTGVDLTAYGADLAERPSLGALARRLLDAVPDLPRLRLSSLDPVEIDEALWHLVAGEPRLMPHLHLSLQHADDLILKRMKRRHSRAQALEMCARARALRPGIALGADLIAGFPTETDAMVEAMLGFVAEARLDYLHVFPFSARPGTPAARMPPVPGPAIRERAARLRAAGADLLRQSLDRRVGAMAAVLIERAGVGRTEHYAPVRFSSAHDNGAVVPMRLAARAGDVLLGAAA